MLKSIIDNKTDEEIKRVAKNSYNKKEFIINIGYKTGEVGAKTRKKINERLSELQITFNNKEKLLSDTILPFDANNMKDIGFIGESSFVFECSKSNIHVSKPLSDNYLYDFIIENNGKMYRIQVKTSNTTDSYGSTNFALVKTSFRKSSGWINKHYSTNDFDYAYLYSMIYEEGYLVPISKCANRKSIAIRKNRSKNNQVKNTNLAEDYLFKKVITEIF